MAFGPPHEAGVRFGAVATWKRRRRETADMRVAVRRSLARDASRTTEGT
jgi:hypothetical protein